MSEIHVDPGAGSRAADFERVLLQLRHMRPYEKTVAYGRAMLFYGDYACLAPPEPLPPLFMLDNVNYSSRVASDPLPLSDILQAFDVAPGYGSITGDYELGPAVRALETFRASTYVGAHASPSFAPDREHIAGMAVLTTAGATGAAHTVLAAALARDREGDGPARTRIVFNAPCYALPDGFAQMHGLSALAVSGQSHRGFLPTVDEITNAVDGGTLACFLTFPTNPSLQSWRSSDVPALARLVEHCQRLGVWLIVDAVFQDLRWGDEGAPEIFALASSSAYLAKLQSPSKDRPFACGYRAGYLIADRALEPWLNRVESLTKNSSSTHNHVWLALDCVFRIALGRGRLDPALFEPLVGRFVFGYGAEALSADEIHARALPLYERYEKTVGAFKASLGAEIDRIHGWLLRSTCFEPAEAPAFGNIVLARVRPPFDAGGDEDRFFLETLIETNVATTVGGCFGMRPHEGVWIRIAVGGAPADEILEALARVEQCRRRRAEGR